MAGRTAGAGPPVVFCVSSESTSKEDALCAIGTKVCIVVSFLVGSPAWAGETGAPAFTETGGFVRPSVASRGDIGAPGVVDAEEAGNCL